MPKGIAVPERDRELIYTRFCLGERQADIAEDFNVSVATVSNIVRQQRKAKEEKMAWHSEIVAGNKRTGRLVSTTDPKRYEGTCVINGRAKSKSFAGVNAREATELWEKWCSDLRDEQSFFDMVERKKPEEPLAVCGAPSDQVEEIRPIKKVVTKEHDGTVYLVWAKEPKVKCYGLFRTVESALTEVDRLNEVAAFLGIGWTFDVEETKFMDVVTEAS